MIRLSGVILYRATSLLFAQISRFEKVYKSLFQRDISQQRLMLPMCVPVSESFCGPRFRNWRGLLHYW